MTGADLLCDTLLVNGIDVCFANPGTSEMAFVAALDRKPQMRCILGLFEGVATGAADGYGRMAGKPAATLLHTGPGLANGLANLHNARRARTPVVNIVGDHATYHLKYDAPLTTDIESLARPMSDWVGRATTPGDVGMTAEAAIIAARTTPGVATMILPADAAWGESDARAAAQPVAIPAAPAVAPERIREIAAAIRGRRIAVLVGGEAARGEAVAAANTICATAGGKLLTEVLTPRVERGRGRPDAARIPYPIDAALAVFKELDVLVLAGAPEQVAFFAYPGRPSRLVPSTCAVLTLARKDEDQLGALLALADEIGAKAAPLRLLERLPDSMPAGPLTDDALSIILARLLPENAILADEGLTSARRLYALSTDAAPHDYLMVTGGSIGLGVPLATGAAIACPDRKVVAVQADGSAMYTLQGLWTQAREQLDVLTIILSNRMYATLRTELANLGVNQVGRNATRMMTLDDPPLDWVSLARGMGVEGARAETCERFAELLREGLARRGPMLIEAVL